ncbi:hypothetical protein CHN51_08815 [Sphingorhabdus sp. YGSMI21]|nr:hypothetical protein CHN51_08815 [Sphingorhabdus sp. YGSMI21]
MIRPWSDSTFSRALSARIRISESCALPEPISHSRTRHKPVKPAISTSMAGRYKQLLRGKETCRIERSAYSDHNPIVASFFA